LYQPNGGGSPLPSRRQPPNGVGGSDPSLQAPPKKIDDLMASLGGGPQQPHPSRGPIPLMTSTPSRPAAPAVNKPPYTNGTPMATVLTPADDDEVPLVPSLRPAASKSTNGPPIYYPPDPMFTKKDAPIVSRNTLERKKKKKAAEAEDEGKGGGAYGGAAVIPICLPVCCAMPCVIM